MGRFSMKLAGFMLLLAFGVFYGVSLTSSGIERIHGPYAGGMETLPPSPGETIEIPSPSPPKKEAPADIKPQSYRLNESEPGVLERAAHKTGTLLQILADHSIRAFVGLFEKILE